MADAGLQRRETGEGLERDCIDLPTSEIEEKSACGNICCDVQATVLQELDLLSSLIPGGQRDDSTPEFHAIIARHECSWHERRSPRFRFEESFVKDVEEILFQVTASDVDNFMCVGTRRLDLPNTTLISRWSGVGTVGSTREGKTYVGGRHGVHRNLVLWAPASGLCNVS